MTFHEFGEQFGDYRLIRLIGRGGFAEVYLGEHYRRKTLAAVKILNTRLAHDNLKSFLNEARSIRLRHPNIVQILDFGLEDDFPFLVMEYAANGSLRQQYPRGTQLSLGTICNYVKQIAGALQYAHDEGVIHRDIKPDNLLLGRKKQILLSDFGIASVAHSTHSMNSEDQAGTINYMAPEQLKGKPRPASDQYALGVVVYEWICGTRPFQGSFAEIHSQQLMSSPPLLRKHVPGLPVAIEKVVMTALAKDPHRRYPTIATFATALEQACKPLGTAHPEENSKFSAQTILLNRSLGKESVDFSTKILQKHKKKTEQESIKERQEDPKIGFWPGELNRLNTLLQGVVHTLKNAKNPFVHRCQFKAGARKRWIDRIQNRMRAWPMAVYIMLVSLIIVGTVFTGLLIAMFSRSLSMTTITITPKSVDMGATFRILASAHNPQLKGQVNPIREISVTSITQSKTVPVTGTSIPGTRATGSLTFFNTGNFDQTFGSVILRGASGVSINFNGPITVPSAPPASLTVIGYAVNVGSAGNIGALDISGSCCATGITVKNGAFSGGRDAQTGTVVQQSDMNGALTALTSTLLPSTKDALKKKMTSSEHLVANTLQCGPSTYAANHAVGDIASSVTVTVEIRCQEEVYDQQLVQTIASNMLKERIEKTTWAHYAQLGNIIAMVSKVGVPDNAGTVAIYVRTEGRWVYQFSNTMKQGFAKHIADLNEHAALRYLLSQPGVKAVNIDGINANLLPDIAHISFQFISLPCLHTFSNDSSMISQPIVPEKNDFLTPVPTQTQGMGGS